MNLPTIQAANLAMKSAVITSKGNTDVIKRVEVKRKKVL